MTNCDECFTWRLTTVAIVALGCTVVLPGCCHVIINFGDTGTSSVECNRTWGEKKILQNLYKMTKIQRSHVTSDDMCVSLFQLLSVFLLHSVMIPKKDWSQQALLRQSRWRRLTLKAQDSSIATYLSLVIKVKRDTICIFISPFETALSCLLNACGTLSSKGSVTTRGMSK